MLSDSLAKEFEAIVGKENVFTSEADRQNYAYDSCVWAPCIPGGVVRPTRTEQLGPIIELCYKEGLPMTKQGAARAPIFPAAPFRTPPTPSSF